MAVSLYMSFFYVDVLFCVPMLYVVLCCRFYVRCCFLAVIVSTFCLLPRMLFPGYVSVHILSFRLLLFSFGSWPLCQFVLCSVFLLFCFLIFFFQLFTNQRRLQESSTRHLCIFSVVFLVKIPLYAAFMFSFLSFHLCCFLSSFRAPIICRFPSSFRVFIEGWTNRTTHKSQLCKQHI